MKRKNKLLLLLHLACRWPNASLFFAQETIGQKPSTGDWWSCHSGLFYILIFDLPAIFMVLGKAWKMRVI